MASRTLDPEFALVVPFSLGALVSLGLVAGDVVPIIDLSDVLLSIGGVDITWARGLSIGALVFVTVNRDASLSDTNGLDLWIAYATIGLVIAPPLLPPLESMISEQPAALIAFAIQTLGFGFVSFAN